MLYKEYSSGFARPKTCCVRRKAPAALVCQVARQMGMSPFHFIRLFKAVFGQSPKQWVCGFDIVRMNRTGPIPAFEFFLKGIGFDLI